MEKLKSVLLVDDDAGTNFLHKIIIEECGNVEQVNICTNGKKALDFLQENIAQSPAQIPNVVFLDINMPVMDGWEFLQEFEKLPEPVRRQCKVVMLTTSVNPDDAQKAMANQNVTAYRNKPLTCDMLKELQPEVDKGRNG
jgi:CheY-like chemotaxis protein